eukprot:GEZU01025141.1.p2 GENE.GEZU01025141.1~~GEZU01025141.1.p2  ORF type:complete len:256 (+),score=90.00 GEZU01025141.1:1468-2235(+)
MSWFGKKNKKKTEVAEEEHVIGSPTGFTQGVHIQVDQEKGSLTGVPDVWKGLAGANTQYIDSSTIDPNLLPKIDNKKKKDAVPQETFHVISQPSAFKREVHVSWDPEKGFTGLPPEWEAMLKSAGIKQSEITKENKDDLISAITFVAKDAANTVNPPQPKIATEGGRKRLADFLSPEDPRKVFGKLEKLDEGSSGSVYKGIHLPTKQKCAIKIIQIKPDTKLETLENEIAMMHTSKHPNIIKYIGCYSCDQDLWV